MGQTITKYAGFKLLISQGSTVLFYEVKISYGNLYFFFFLDIKDSEENNLI